MNDKQLTIWFDGREALPVRAIPYVADWNKLLSPDVVAKSFAYGNDWYSARCVNLTSYHLHRNKPVEVKRREWNKVVVQMGGLDAELFQKYGKEGLGGKIGYAVWQRESASKLPAGVFVWLDEFEKEYQVECRREERISKQFIDATLVLTPMAADADTRAMVMEGFEEFEKVNEQKLDDNDKTLNAKDAIINNEHVAMSSSVEQFVPVAPKVIKGKAGRPKTIDKKVIVVRDMMARFERAASIQFTPQALCGSAADLLDACQRFEKSNKIKPLEFRVSQETFNVWLKKAGYSFPTGRTLDIEKNYWTQLVVKVSA